MRSSCTCRHLTGCLASRRTHLGSPREFVWPKEGPKQMQRARLWVLVQEAGQGLEFDVAQCMARYDRGLVKRETQRTAIIIRRSHGHLMPYDNTP